jgi:cytochrome c oxidase subunit II
MKVFPENISDIGLEIDNLFWIITGVVALASIITLFLFLYPILTRKRNRAKAEMYMTGNSHEKRKWVYVGMILLLVGDLYILMSEHSIWHRVEQTLPEADFKVAIVGKQWMWTIFYPGPDGKLYTADDVMAVNELHLPKDKVVHMDLKAMDVIHSVFLPQARFKQDVLPGRTITRWVKLNKEGKFDISCTEICGIGHSMMRGDLFVENDAKWQQSMNKIYGFTK